MTPFHTILADPAWPYDDGLTMSATKRGAASNYPTMSVQEICDLYQPSVVTPGRPKRPGTLAGHPIADVAFLGLWVTKDVLLDGVAVRVCHAWGFTPKQIVPWVKGRIGNTWVTSHEGDDIPAVQLILQMGMGRIFRNVVEYLVIGARGKNYSNALLSKGSNGLILAEEDSVILAPRSTHSTKPEASYQLIERTLPGPYLELFARRPREGWTTWGNEINGSITTDSDGAVTDRVLEVPGMRYRQQIVHPDTPIEWP